MVIAIATTLPVNEVMIVKSPVCLGITSERIVGSGSKALLIYTSSCFKKIAGRFS
jgi:hypothetical protein